jgi:hypothetical protein
MIRLTKGPKPNILVQRAEGWTDDLVQTIAAGEVPTPTQRHRYRHREVRDALIRETHGKCAYCESKVRHVAHGDIEHIVPKSLAPERSFDWENLTLACDVCNENKGDFAGNHDNFVDPYLMEPSDHVFFAGALLLPVAGSDPGVVTEDVLDLNRPDLFERRTDRLRHLNALLQVLARTQNADAKAAIRTDIEENETSASKEFSALSRTFLNAALPLVS